SVRSITAEAAKNRTIPPPPKTVNSQTAKNSTKTDNNLKFNNFYFRTLNTLFQNTLNPKSKQLKTTNLHINK
ncbi:hypothetical protein, partial [Neisseria sicca]|uniref:hypothetical protein n=1 Tax=Neisseria sicca TaxID=490 RepID=UPI003C762EED